MIDVTSLMGTVFSGLSELVIEDVEDAGEVICVRARTRDGAVACPGCGAETARVHEYRERTVADVRTVGSSLRERPGARLVRTRVGPDRGIVGTHGRKRQSVVRLNLE